MILTLVMWLLVVVSPGNASLPAIVGYADPKAVGPIWVSADAAFTEEGALKTSLFPSLAYSHRAAAESSERRDGKVRLLRHAECTASVSGTVTHDFADRTAQQAIENARSVLRGRILKLHYGFFSERPGVLLEATVLSTPRPLRRGRPDRVFVFVNYARFAVGSNKYCTGTVEPRVGDEFIVFIGAEPIDELGLIVSAQDRIVFSQGNRVVSPRYRELDKALTLNVIERDVLKAGEVVK